MTSTTLAQTLGLPDQTRRILAYLQEGKALTPMKAQTLFNEWRLAARIHQIRKAGIDIACDIMHTKGGKKYGKYVLVVPFQPKVAA